jgi:SAM-dependent methyltransferase
VLHLVLESAMSDTQLFPPIPVQKPESFLLYEKSIKLVDSKDLNNALKVINEAIQITPNQVDYYNYQGFIYFNLNEYTSAVDSFDQCINLNPNNKGFWNNRNLALAKCKNTASLELGCGIHHKNPFNAATSYGIDIREDLESNILKADLTIEPIPFPDNSFDFVIAEHFLEHVPRLIYAPTHRFPFIDLMSEIYRVLKPRGLFYSITPAYPHPEAFQDPTHVNIITDKTLAAYFCFAIPWAKQYGFKGQFNFSKQDWEGPCLRTWINKM